MSKEMPKQMVQRLSLNNVDCGIYLCKEHRDQLDGIEALLDVTRHQLDRLERLTRRIEAKLDTLLSKDRTIYIKNVTEKEVVVQLPESETIGSGAAISALQEEDNISWGE